jgi:hypothetical protein
MTRLPLNSEDDGESHGRRKTRVAAFLTVFCLVATALGIGVQMVRQAGREELLENGAAGVARITRVSETGNRSNHKTEARIELEVTGADGRVFDAEVRAYVTADELGAYVVGARLDVRFSAADPREVVVVGRR